MMPKRTHKPSVTDWLEAVPDTTRRDFLAKVGKTALLASLGMCTATGNSGHSLNQDCGIIPIYLKGVSDGETKTKKLHARV